MANLARKSEYMFVKMEGKWSAEELKEFIESVNRIYNSFCILNMIKNHDIHEGVIEQAIHQLEIYDKIRSSTSWHEEMDSSLAGKITTEAVFKLFEQYVNESEKLLIKAIKHSSPGGTEYEVLGPIKKLEIKDKSPLEQTTMTCKNIEYSEDDENIEKEITLENRSIDPRIVQLNKNIIKGPIEKLRELFRAGKIKNPKIVNSSFVIE